MSCSSATTCETLRALHRAQEIEIAAQIRLRDVLQEQAAIAAVVLRGRGAEGGEAPLDLFGGHIKFDAARGHVQAISSPVRTTASGPPIADSGATCSTTVPKLVPLMRASLMRTMSATP